MLVYGGGSIKKNGIYDKVVEILKSNKKEIFMVVRLSQTTKVS